MDKAQGLDAPEMAAEWVPIDQLKPWERNPRINEHAVPRVAKSIERFGFAAPIVARRADNEVIAGHTRLKAAVLAGLTQVPVRFMELSADEAHQLGLADNKLAEIAQWEDAELSRILKEMSEASVDLDGLGFDEGALEQLSLSLAALERSGASVGLEPRRNYDQVPERVEPKTRDGERVELGRHELRCGDCIDAMKDAPPDTYHAIVTDPPYGIGLGQKDGKDWDAEVPGGPWAEQCLRVLRPGGHIIAFSSTRTVHRLAAALEGAGFEIRDQISWLYWQGMPKGADLEKLTGLPKWAGWNTTLKPSQEPAILARKPLLNGALKNTLIKHDTGGINVKDTAFDVSAIRWPGPASGVWPSNIIHCPKPTIKEKQAGTESLPMVRRDGVNRTTGAASKPAPRGNFHPTVKPVELMRWLVRLVTPPGGLVLEPFAGSGTTLVAAELEGFRCHAIEKDKAYCDIARARFAAAEVRRG